MAVKRLYWLPVGRCAVDHSALDTRQVPGRLVDLPIWTYLVETTEGPILIDTGMPDACVHDPEGYFRGTEDEGLIVPHMTEEDRIVRALAHAGYRPTDLLCVISSHWHFDHGGGNAHFPDIPILVQRAEYEAAMTGNGYPKECRVQGLRYQLLDGDAEPVPGLRLLYTPGHSPGHQSILVETQTSGPVLLTIDASYTRANFEDHVPFAGVDPNQMGMSLVRLKEVARAAEALVFFGHDPDQARDWPVFPRYL